MRTRKSHRISVATSSHKLERRGFRTLVPSLYSEILLITCIKIFYTDHSRCGERDNDSPRNLDYTADDRGGGGALWGRTKGYNEDSSSISVYGSVEKDLALHASTRGYIYLLPRALPYCRGFVCVYNYVTFRFAAMSHTFGI